ncbi:MAG: substrate-binding domain-containing protein [Gemmatimonadota bacterium]|nr:MAG: substrate-binding domain-containing protein [Gemmatimonadota bacterium]
MPRLSRPPLVLALLLVLVIVIVLETCTSRPSEIVLASTTSTEDSGLFEAILPAFRRAHPDYRVRVIAVGSGEALRLAGRGDADVVLAHSPRAEQEFMAAGHGESRRRVMYNDFVIVGPADDPARVCGFLDAPSALACIAENGLLVISRGDDSGTHARERELWSAARVAPSGDWYREAGQGMGAVLMMASERRAYTLSDRGTYLSLRDRLALDVVVEGDPRLRNQYSVIVVRGASNAEGARAFADWMTGVGAQRLIGEFGVERLGQALFTPNAGIDE